MVLEYNSTLETLDEGAAESAVIGKVSCPTSARVESVSVTEDFWIIVETREETSVTVTSGNVADKVTPVSLAETKEEPMALCEGNEAGVLEDQEAEDADVDAEEEEDDNEDEALGGIEETTEELKEETKLR